MASPKNVTQKEVNAVWAAEWERQDASPDVFKQRLFVEGFAAFRPYFPEDPKHVLDVGGGTGRYGIALAREFPEAEVTVTDILDEALAIGRKLAAAVGVANVRFERADALRLPYADDTFDLVFSDVVIQHIPQYKNALREMVRVLRPGGTLIISSVNGWNPPHRLYRFLQCIRGVSYEYGYERDFSPIEMMRLLKGYHVERVKEDGFYFAYGVYRWKKFWSGWAAIGKIVNRASRILDLLTRRWWSRLFGFEIFLVAWK